MGKLEGKVAFITGAARGQGRAHAVRLAEEGADIIATDICAELKTSAYPMATEADLAETVKQVESLGRRVVARKADVRDLEALESAVAAGLDELGHIDIVCANAGFMGFGRAWEMDEETWEETIDVDLTGVWKTLRAALPSMIERGAGGSVILTSSTAGRKGHANIVHYTAAKHGVVGIMRTLLNEVSQFGIRVNTLHPTSVSTDMVHNESTYGAFMPDKEHPSRDEVAPRFAAINALSVPWIEPRDVAHAVAWLASDEARWVTGGQIPIDAGFHEKTG